jgi:hypothetical protein
MTNQSESGKAWAVSIKRADGSEFLASGGGHGFLPAVFLNRDRVRVFKRTLTPYFKCRIVRVAYVLKTL